MPRIYDGWTTVTTSDINNMNYFTCDKLKEKFIVYIS